jgi:Domain of unknown function (DUF4265)
MNKVKLQFQVNSDDGTHETETLWADPVDGDYRLDNIPFIVRGFALGDIVKAVPDGDGLLRCIGLKQASGHSTVRIVLFDKSILNSLRETLRSMDCSSELDGTLLLAVDVPPTVSYSAVRQFLDEKERSGVLEFEEGCLAQ